MRPTEAGVRGQEHPQPHCPGRVEELQHVLLSQPQPLHQQVIPQTLIVLFVQKCVVKKKKKPLPCNSLTAFTLCYSREETVLNNLLTVSPTIFISVEGKVLSYKQSVVSKTIS